MDIKELIRKLNKISDNLFDNCKCDEGCNWCDAGKEIDKIIIKLKNENN